MAMLVNSNDRGKAFEKTVGDLLNCLRKHNPGKTKTDPGAVGVNSQPKIKLHNSEVLTSDFELICRLDHIRNRYFIECQDRKRSSQEIVHKIRHIKSLSNKNDFIFVYKDESFLSEGVRKALDNDGIVHYSLDQFTVFLVKLNATMGKISGRIKDKDEDCLNFMMKLRSIEGIFSLEQLTQAEKEAILTLIENQPVSDQGMLSDRRY